MLTLYATKGCGSTIAEACLELCGVEYDRREVVYGIRDPNAATLRKVNPLGQVPTLVLEDGGILTETAAIALWLMDRDGAGALGPGPDHRDRARFLRWLIYFPAAIYPMYTVGDEPEAWVGDEAGRGCARPASSASSCAGGRSKSSSSPATTSSATR